MRARRRDRANRTHDVSGTTTGTSFAQSLFDEAVRHHQASELATAEQLYRQVLAIDARHADSLHLLGVIAYQSERHAVAADLIRKAIGLQCGNASYYSNLGNVLQSQGKMADAIALYKRAIALKPGYADAHNNLGTALQTQGNLVNAATHYKRALTAEPNHVQAHINLGNVLKSQNKLTEAVAHYQSAISLNPDYAEAHNNLANALMAQGKPIDAVVHYERAIALNPGAADVHLNLGNVLLSRGKNVEAEKHYQCAITLNPKYAIAHYCLGNMFKEQGKLVEAVAHYQLALALKPATAEIHVNLGNVLRMQGELSAAAENYAQAIAIKPNLAIAHSNLGNVLKEMNNLPEAVACYERAIALEPGYHEAYHNLGNVYVIQGKIEDARRAYITAIESAPRNTIYYRHLSYIRRAVDGDRYVMAMEQLKQDMQALKLQDQKELHFALGKAYDDRAQYERAFDHFLKGNALKRRELMYDEPAALAMFDRIRAAFTAELMHRKRNVGFPSPIPIFIVGMPRSGTTLVEQILASHPGVYGAGERREFDQVMAALKITNGDPPFPEVVPVLPDEKLRRLGGDYLDTLIGKAPCAVRITDKMPENFRHLGLIHLALPNARIIHVRRDPIDTCLSCFTLLFEEGQMYSYDLGELGHFYRAYATLMEHWRSVLPAGTMLEVLYEDLVADTEEETRRILAYCGLEWDKACLAFHQTERPVWTASSSQVRQPIYRTSIGRWRPYSSFLQPLMRALGLAGTATGVA